MVERCKSGSLQQLMCTPDLLRVAMHDQHELVGLQRGFVAQYGVLRNSDRHQGAGERADAADQHRALQAAEECGRKRAQNAPSLPKTLARSPALRKPTTCSSVW